MRRLTSQLRRTAGRGRRLPLAGLAVLSVLGATAAVASGSASMQRSLAAPTGLQAFQLRAGDTKGATPTFSQTPSFAWNPVHGASHYEFELASSKSFAAGNGLLYASRTFRTPVAAIPISLPWITNRTPDILYWRVRALIGENASAWSAPAGFRMGQGSAPTRLPGGPGYVKWAAVPGATGYDVWFENLHKVVSTPTTMVDLRDYYADSAPTEAIWRVRAERHLYGSDKRALPLFSYGPWSAEYHTTIAPNAAAGLATLSPGAEARAQAPTHTQMPVFLFPAADKSKLEHMYVASDSACTKLVFNSPIVQGGAYAPRSSQYVPTTVEPIAANAGPVYMQDGTRIRPTEAGPTRTAAAATGNETSATLTRANVDLPSGKYWWTVVPVERRSDNSFHDLKSPKTTCASNKASFTMTVGVASLTKSKVPFATGLSPSGHLASATSSPGQFYGVPLVAWSSVPGATQYQVEWSHYSNKWQSAGGTTTYATSATLPLGPGTWFYHVRAVDTATAEPRWSAPAELQISTPTFSVIGKTG